MTRQFRLLILAVLLAVGAFAFWRWAPMPMLMTAVHVPAVYERRSGELTANITGRLSPLVQKVEAQVNGGPWTLVEHDRHRAPPPQLTVEMVRDQLAEGDNRVVLRAWGWGREEVRELRFVYRDDPVALPRTVEWSPDSVLDVHDGTWEVFAPGPGQGWRVRPKPGYEDYDRILVVAAAFPGGRRVSTDLVFHGSAKPGKPYGFGLLPLWGGRPQWPGHALRQGWIFSCGWYYSHYEGVGMEFSTRYPGGEPDWVSVYRNFEIKPGTRYRLTVEAWPETDAEGRHLRWRQRMRWQADGQEGEVPWMHLADDWGAPLPDGEYSVALIAHRSRVDFGPVTVEPLTVPPTLGSYVAGR